MKYCTEKSEDSNRDKMKIEEKDVSSPQNMSNNVELLSTKDKDKRIRRIDSWHSKKVCLESITEEDYKLKKCTLCQKQYTTKIGLIQHVSAVHKGLRFSCDECDYKTTVEQYVQRHKLSQHRKLKHQCPQCFGLFSKGGLSIHIKAVHKKETFQCEQCGFSTRCNSTLKNHRDYYHEGIINFKCEKCDYSSYRKYNVDIHRKNMHESINVPK